MCVYVLYRILLYHATNYLTHLEPQVEMQAGRCRIKNPRP
jgi:hypothetical protein